LIITTCPWDYLKHLDRVKVMRRNARRGLQTRTNDELCWGKNSGAAAVNLALLLGASKIVLLGFDMKVDMENGKHEGHNWHDSHKRWRQKAPEDKIYVKTFIPTFIRIRADLERFNNNGSKRKLEILNATPGSALEAFPMVELGATL